MTEIKALRKQLDKSLFSKKYGAASQEQRGSPTRDTPSHRQSRDQTGRHFSNEYERIRALLDTLSDKAPRVPGRIYQGGEQLYPSGRSSADARNNRDIRALLDELSDSLASLDIPSMRVYDVPSSAHGPDPNPENGGNTRKDFRTLMDRIVQKDWELQNRHYYTESGSEATRRGKTERRRPAPGPVILDTPQIPPFPASGSQNTGIGPGFGTDLSLA